MSERGSIRHLSRYKQLISYEGLERMRKITPTDIDGVIDYGGRAFFYIEGKHIDNYNESGMQKGQRMAIESIVKSHERAGHQACCVIFVHNIPSSEIIIAKNMYVVECFYRKEWIKIKLSDEVTLLDSIERFEAKFVS